jgi:glycosyltransferase involved in cell wall biosynthesis
MNKIEFLTVLMTTYNASEYLEYSIKSILSQTFTNYEFLIIDDGSTDSTREIIESIIDKRFRYEFISHVGRSKALNFGLKQCKYNWVALMDADDIAHPERLEKQFAVTLKRNSVIISSCVYFKENKLLLKIDVSRLKFPHDLILHQKFPNSVLYNRQFILENGGYNENITVAEDYELWLRIMDKTEFIVIKEVLMFIRYIRNSLSRGNIQKTNLTIYRIQENYYKELEQSFGIIKKKEQNKYIGWREYFFGDLKLARKYWLKYIISFFDLRLLMAFFITFLPLNYIEKFKQSSVKLRLKYFINHFCRENKGVEKEFNQTLARIKMD